jgi:redox-sensing transcriptional repressor
MAVVGAGHFSEPEARLSRATAQRFSLYLRCLGSAARNGGTVSSVELARAVGVSAAQVRRDLAALGNLGQRGVGYDAAGLATAIRRTLGIDRPWRAVLVGVGNLARALLRYRGFRDQGFLIVGLFDNDPAKVGQVVEGRTGEPTSAIPARVPALRAELGVLTVPSEPAQAVADALTTAGVRGLLNFAPVLLRTPPSVRVVTVDLAIQLEQLAFLVQLPDGSAEGVERPSNGR